eukprot:scaffold4391_cov36-Cyclotella_meneghiniana.AAC.2
MSTDGHGHLDMDMERLELEYMKKLTADGHGVEVTGAVSAATHTPQKLEGRWGREYWGVESVKSKQIGSAQNMAGGPVTLPLILLVSHGSPVLCLLPAPCKNRDIRRK